MCCHVLYFGASCVHRNHKGSELCKWSHRTHKIKWQMRSLFSLTYTCRNLTKGIIAISFAARFYESQLLTLWSNLALCCSCMEVVEDVLIYCGLWWCVLGQGSLTIRPFSSPGLKNILVNCSTFVFLLNFSFMK